MILAPLKTPISVLQKKRAFATVHNWHSFQLEGPLQNRIWDAPYNIYQSQSYPGLQHFLESYLAGTRPCSVLEEIQGKDALQHQKLWRSKVPFPWKIKLFQRGASQSLTSGESAYQPAWDLFAWEAKSKQGVSPSCTDGDHKLFALPCRWQADNDSQTCCGLDRAQETIPSH